jgi:hypothetical protein
MLHVMAEKKYLCLLKFVDMVEENCGMITTFIAHGNMSLMLRACICKLWLILLRLNLCNL